MAKGDTMEKITDEKNAPHIFMGVMIGIVALVAAVLFILDYYELLPF